MAVLDAVGQRAAAGRGVVLELPRLDTERVRRETRSSWVVVDKCLGQNKDGSACQAKPRPGTSHCPWHDEALVGQRRAWSQKGGRSRSTKARTAKRLPSEVMTLTELQGVLCVVLRDVIDGKTEPAIGNCAAGLARAIAAVAQAGDLEERITGLEAAAGLGGKSA